LWKENVAYIVLKKNSKEVSEGTSKSTYLDRINWVNSLYWKQTSHDDVDVELVNCPNAPGRLKIQKNLVFQQKNNLPAAYNNNKQTQVDNKRLYFRVVRFATVFEFLTGDEICLTVSLKKLKSKKSRILNQI